MPTLLQPHFLSDESVERIFRLPDADCSRLSCNAGYYCWHLTSEPTSPQLSCLCLRKTSLNSSRKGTSGAGLTRNRTLQGNKAGSRPRLRRLIIGKTMLDALPRPSWGRVCLIRLGVLEPLQRYPYRHSHGRLSRRPAVRGAVIMVSRGGTYSAKVNKYQRSFPEYAAVFDQRSPRVFHHNL